MVTSFLPVFNLLNQFLKQISKPLSFRMIKYAKTHPEFRKYFLILPGRRFHTLDKKVRRQLSGSKENGLFMREEKVDDETALDAGANLMSECIIFIIAGLGVTAEVYRTARNTAAKEAVKIKEMQNLIDKKETITATVEKQSIMINELEKLVNECISHTPTTVIPSENQEE